MAARSKFSVRSCGSLGAARLVAVRQILGDRVGGFLERTEAVDVAQHEVPDTGAALLLVTRHHVDQYQSVHRLRTGALGDQDAGQSAHAGPDHHDAATDRCHDVQHIGRQGFHGVVGAGSAVAVAVSAGVQRNDVVPLVGQDLPGVFPGKSVLAATVQHQDCRPIGRCGAAVPFVGDQGDPTSTGKRDRLGAAAHGAHGS